MNEFLRPQFTGVFLANSRCVWCYTLRNPLNAARRYIRNLCLFYGVWKVKYYYSKCWRCSTDWLIFQDESVLRLPQGTGLGQDMRRQFSSVFATGDNTSGNEIVSLNVCNELINLSTIAQ